MKEFFNRVMPPRFLGGRFSLSRIRKECNVKSDLESDLMVKNDLPEFTSKDLSLSHIREECDVKSDLSVKNDIPEFTSEDLKLFTGKFSPDNLIGVSQFGKLYRGKMPTGETTKDVSVKVVIDSRRFGDHNDLLRFEDELKFLQHPRITAYPNLTELIGYCRKGNFLAVVYDLNPHDTLQNLITRDDFKWPLRINVALAIARLLNFLHNRKSPYLIRNLCPAHIVVDKALNPILFDFGFLLGSGLDKTSNNNEAIALGYTDPVVALEPWSVEADVFSFGALLLNLMSKIALDRNNVKGTIIVPWASREYKPGCSLVHQSLQDDPSFDSRDGPKVTDLAMQCINDERAKRPLMKEVVDRLESLHVAQQHVKMK